MGKSSSARRGQFWRTDWFVAVLVVMAVVMLNLATDVIGTVERRFCDFASTSSGRQPSDRIAVVAIDDQGIANIGRWPWPPLFEAPVLAIKPAGMPPGYDATQKTDAGGTEAFSKTAVISRPGAPGSPAEGGDKTDVKA